MRADSAQQATLQPAGFEGCSIIDCDVHSEPVDAIGRLLPERWRRYVERTGIRCYPERAAATSNGAFRLDTFPPHGRPGTDPGFAREQLLDEYGLTAALLNTMTYGSGNIPNELANELARASNDFNEEWLESDPRWIASINVAMGDPAAAVAEVLRCRAKSERYAQILLDPNSERPPGNPLYWPIYEVAAELGIPVGFHIFAKSKHRLDTGVGQVTYYYELRTALDILSQPLASSMIFEGVFDRWPTLKVALLETDWSWLVPMAWRLDATWRVLRDDVPDLQRRPSDYLRDHFWATTQPGVETEHPNQIYELFDQLERNGFGNQLMFSTDYPHWDMDSPFEAIPRGLAFETKWNLLGGNAAALYGIELPPPAKT